MSPPSLARAERDAFAALLIHADDGAHRRWCAARAAIQEASLASGGILDARLGPTYVCYRIGRYGQLKTRVVHFGS